MDVFISYNMGDSAQVERFCSELRKLGIVPWRYTQQPSQADWERIIPDKISKTFATIVFWTPNSINRDLVRAEAKLAKQSRKLIQVLLGTKPPFGFDSLPGDDLSMTTFADTDWRGFVNLVHSTLVANGWKSPAGIGQETDWVSWCAENRRGDLEALAGYAIKCGLIFLYGAEQWSDVHLQAMGRVAMADKHILRSDPEANILEAMLDFNEIKAVASIPFVSHLSELNAVLAATAFTFANEINFEGCPKLPLVTSSALSNPAEFVDVYFRSTLEMDGETKSPSHLEKAGECFRFFFDLLAHMLDSQPDTVDQMVVVWPLKLIDALLSKASGQQRKKRGELLRKPDVFATQLMEGVKALLGSPLQGRVGFIVQASCFPRTGTAAPVAKRCIVVAPPLSIGELRKLAVEKFPATGDKLNVEAVLEATGGIWLWLDPLFHSYAHILESATPDDDGATMAGLISYLSGYLREPNAAREVPEALPPPRVLQELQPLIDQAREMPRELQILATIYTPQLGRSPAAGSLKWTESYDPLIRGTLASLITRETGGENPVSRFQVFSNYPYVSYAPMPGFVAALTYFLASHNVVR